MKKHKTLMSIGMILTLFLSVCALVREKGPTPNPKLDVVEDSEDIKPPTSDPKGSEICLPASCLQGTARGLPFINAVDGYCLRYPARFRVDDVYPPGIANLYGPPHDDSPEPVAAGVSLVVEPAIGSLTLAEAADKWLGNRQAQAATERIAGTLGGEPAEIVEYPGDRSGARTVFAVFEDKLYALTFYPVDERFPEAAPDVEEVWRTVMHSFAFLSPEAKEALLPLPEGEPLPPQDLPLQMKGYELYSWQSGGDWYFTLITGTNRLKTLAELTTRESAVKHDWVKITVNGVSDVKAALGRLPSGARVVWYGKRDLPRGYPVPEVTLELPPTHLVEEVQSWCSEQGIQIKVSP